MKNKIEKCKMHKNVVIIFIKSNEILSFKGIRNRETRDKCNREKYCRNYAVNYQNIKLKESVMKTRTHVLSKPFGLA